MTDIDGAVQEFLSAGGTVEALPAGKRSWQCRVEALEALEALEEPITTWWSEHLRESRRRSRQRIKEEEAGDCLDRHRRMRRLESTL